MSAPTPPHERQVRCLVHRKASGPHAGLIHVCSEPIHHDGDHVCGGVIGCGTRWPRAS